MSRKLFVFPGQGSQEIGMGADLFNTDEFFCLLIKQASDITGEDLKALCLKGPEKKLLQSRYLQPLIVAVSLGYLRHIQQKNIKADFVLGHSLGEITALAAAEVINSELAINIAAKRGELMDEAASFLQGGMLAVLSLDFEKVNYLITESGLGQKIFIANDNAPGEIVVSGELSALESLSLIILKEGGRSKKLNVSGPWHSPYLQKAYESFKLWVASIPFALPRVPVILNSSGTLENSADKIKESISAQLCKPVNFRKCMEYCRDKNISQVFEIGPGKVLSGLVRANGFMQGVDVYRVNNLRGVALVMP